MSIKQREFAWLQFTKDRHSASLHSVYLYPRLGGSLSCGQSRRCLTGVGGGVRVTSSLLCIDVYHNTSALKPVIKCELTGGPGDTGP